MICFAVGFSNTSTQTVCLPSFIEKDVVWSHIIYLLGSLSFQNTEEKYVPPNKCQGTVTEGEFLVVVLVSHMNTAWLMWVGLVLGSLRMPQSCSKPTSHGPVSLPEIRSTMRL